MKPSLPKYPPHFYGAYGLIFVSEIVLPELLPAPATPTPDITIRLGSVPSSLVNPTLRDSGFDLTENELRFEVEGIAGYLVAGGCEIVVQPAADSQVEDVRTYVLGSCLGALLHQRRVLPLHASAIETEQGAVLFMGESGRGKSTLLNAFLKKGYPMLTDDIAGVVVGQHGAPVVLSGFPRTKLRADAFERLHQPSQTSGRWDGDKFHQSPPHFRAEPLTIWRIYRLASPAVDTVEITPLTRYQAVESVMNNLYRPLMMVRQGQRQSSFEQLSALVGQVEVYQLSRVSTLEQLPHLIDLIEQHFKNRDL